MYNPDHFKETNSEEIQRIMRDHPLALVVYNGAGGLTANHLPLIYNPQKNQLIGHIAKNNIMGTEITDNSAILAIFSGENAYISPNYYPIKHETHRAVPTWAYQAVHVNGRVFFHHDDKNKRAIVGQLTKTHESQTPDNIPWRMADAPADYMEDMLQKIIGFTIEIDSINAKSKLNQNHPQPNKLGVVEQLTKRGRKSFAQTIARLNGL